MQGAGNDSYPDKAKKSIQSGCDMILVCNNRKEIENIINEFDEIGVKPIKKLSEMKKSMDIDWHELNKSNRKKQIKIKLEAIRS